jgi:exodeoxyribonuclease V alpha subunit
MPSSNTPGRLPQGPTTLEGVLDRITYANEENAWSVVKLAVPHQADLVTAVGNLLGVSPGESLRLRGQWINDRQYGPQFKVEAFETVKPGTLLGIERYLGSGLVRGLGKAMATRIVQHFGLQTFDVIEKQPERLREVEGIGPVRLKAITAAWAEQRAVREVMLFLQAHGVSTLLAVRIYKHYGEQAVSIVKQDPYRLAMEVFGIGFRTADALARALGVQPDSPQRVRAGVLHVLSQLSDDGHLYFPRGRLCERAAEVLEVKPELVDRAIAELCTSRHLVAEPLPDGDEAVYLSALHAAESGLAEMLLSLLRIPPRPMPIDVPKAIDWFERRRHITLADEQREAVSQAVQSKALVITGGPGTGKTTLVSGIIEILQAKGLEVLLTAPTGRAAKRLSEATGAEARTLHRLLEYSPVERVFKRDRYRPLAADCVILDEASMVDAVLAFHVLKALPPQCRLILVGDVDQLPSVGPGNVLTDIIGSGTVPVVKLQHVFRQAQQSLIVTNAHRINRGELPEVVSGDASDFFVIERDRPEDVIAAVKELVSERIPRRFKLDPVDHIQVLTPMNKGPLGAHVLNHELQTLLNPQGPAVTRGDRTLRAGDKVMQLRNNYDLEVFNGDVGRILEIDPVEHQLSVDMDGRVVTYEYAQLDELTVAYAATIHKAQGSEYPAVVILMHNTHAVMLARNLLYTGITRGRQLVVLVGSKKAISQAVHHADAHQRLSRLRERLQTTTNPVTNPNSNSQPGSSATAAEVSVLERY